MKPCLRVVYHFITILIVAVSAIFWVKPHLADDHALPPTITVEVRPQKVNLQGSRPVTVVVVARNTSAEPVRDLTLSWITPLDLDLSGSDLEGVDLPPFGETAWTLSLNPAEGSTLAGEIDFRVDYKWEMAENGSPTISRVQWVSLPVETAERPILEQVATLKVDSTTGTINEQRPGTIYLLLANVYPAPVNIESLLIDTAGGLTVTYDQNRFPLVLEPGDQVSIPVAVVPGNRVQPGAHLLLIKVPLSWQHNGELQRGTLAATQGVEVGVLGESDILTLLGVPTLLLLPGFLIIFTMRLGWLLGKSAEEKKEFPLSPLKIDFWFFAIITSLVAAAVYPLATTILGNPRDFLQGYGLIDIYYIFTGSVLFGVLVITAARAIVYVRQVNQAQQDAAQAAKIPKSDDLPPAALNRLALQGLDLNLSRVRIKLENEEVQLPVFLLGRQGVNGAEIWVGPGIDIPEADLSDDLYGKIDAIRQTGTDIQGFLALVKEHGIRLRWDSSWPLPGPTRLPREDILEFLAPEVIIRLS